jgi:DNA uptake protein ComE-like DNA-binding protein
MPGMTPAIAKALVAKRPIASAVELNSFLLAQGLTQEQAAAFYGKAFVHINLNTATPEEILLVPNAGKRMVREFDEYRPWKTYAQFDKEIGKYVGAEATAKLAQYTFIPMDANTATDEALMTIPGANAALVARIKGGRPYKSAADLEQAVAKGATPAEGKRVARYFVF